MLLQTARASWFCIVWQKWIIRIPERGFAVIAFGTLLIERSMQTYAFDQVWVCNVLAAEGDAVPRACGDEIVGVFACDADVQDYLSAVNLPKVMDHCIAGESGDRRLRKIRHLPHKEHMREVITVELLVDIVEGRQRRVDGRE